MSYQQTNKERPAAGENKEQTSLHKHGLEVVGSGDLNSPAQLLWTSSPSSPSLVLPAAVLPTSCKRRGLSGGTNVFLSSYHSHICTPPIQSIFSLDHASHHEHHLWAHCGSYADVLQPFSSGDKSTTPKPLRTLRRGCRPTLTNPSSA